MTKAGETDHDKELQKAFAEFKQSLRHDPHASHEDKAPGLLAPEIIVAEPRRPLAPHPKVDTRPVLGANPSLAETERSVATAPPSAPTEGRRRGLLYLSAAIVVGGLAALGWALNHGVRPEAVANEPATAAVAPQTPSPETTATTEPPTSSATAETPVPEAPQAAANPSQPPSPASTASDQAKNPAAPATVDQPPVAEKAALSPSPAAVAAPSSPATPEQTPVKTQTPNTGVQQTAAPTTQADAAAIARPKQAIKPKVAKTKTKPAPARSAGRAGATTKISEPAVAAPAPVAETAPPPPPPPSSDGALGFVKRTVNSVGSTITNIGRGAIGN